MIKLLAVLFCFSIQAEASNVSQFFSGKSGQMKLYQSNGTTLIGYFLGFQNSSQACENITYADLTGATKRLSTYDCGAAPRDLEVAILYSDSTCTTVKGYTMSNGTFLSTAHSVNNKYQLYNLNGGNSITIVLGSCTSSSPTTSYYRLNNDPACLSGFPTSNWCPISSWTNVTLGSRICDGTSSQAATNNPCKVLP